MKLNRDRLTRFAWVRASKIVIWLLASAAACSGDDDDTSEASQDASTSAGAAGTQNAGAAGTASTDSAGAAAAGSSAAGGASGAASADVAGSSAAGSVATAVESGATWTEVYDSIFPRCTSCHGGDTGDGDLALGDDAQSAYAALVGQTSTSPTCGQQPYVVPGEPDQSLLFAKLTAPPCGAVMPYRATPLSDTELELVRSWIAAGAALN